ncbi:hypothetical protein FHS18_005642 [Paenibacillus phyllosphaerae]|uniref:DUF5658 domain-containing protein n=1 Tax=Paenibacillus phyllosphaerae TaxID=274593 RepID=A0A7W5FQJ4_9BACL|nr:DUF5658 family protein [Paenibacillus phyllosphaerae]MBB3113530.1 hypothetical protein [Paenibacillus phyllosphaerae]
MKRLSIKPLLVALIILCLSDAVFTDIGLRASLIQELNPLVRHVYEWNVAAYYFGKIILPVILLMLLPYLKVRMWMKSLMMIATAAYAAVNLYHIFWVALAFKALDLI